MKRDIFFKSFIITLVSVLIVFFSGIVITYFTNKKLVSERLKTETELTVALLDSAESFSALDIFRDQDECRVTVISLNGDVLYDSDTVEELENHIDREEVAAAVSGEPKIVVRYSETFGCEMTYYAIMTEFSDGEEVLIRLAVRSGEINTYIVSSIPFLLLALVISAVIAGIFAGRLSDSVAKRISDISSSLKLVAEGDYKPLPTDIKDSELVSIYNDINELNAKTVSYITAQKELSRQKEEFFANASHELKTPLTAMLGLTEIALAKEEDEGTRRQLERIHKESLRLSELISDMLKLSNLESLKDDETAVSVSMESIATEVISELASLIKAKNIKATVKGSATVIADEKRMYELMQNLCSNAVNYNKDGGEIEIILEQNANGATVRVRDTGIGIAEENIPHLCERFYRVDKSRSKKTGGTGLGLAIVKHICALYEAELSIKSKLSEGTEVKIVFKE